MDPSGEIVCIETFVTSDIALVAPETMSLIHNSEYEPVDLIKDSLLPSEDQEGYLCPAELSSYSRVAVFAVTS
jgi:hypothetical protein